MQQLGPGLVESETLWEPSHVEYVMEANSTLYRQKSACRTDIKPGESSILALFALCMPDPTALPPE